MTGGDAWKSDLVDPLDGKTGPALPCSEPEQLAIAHAVAQRAAQRRGRVGGERGRGWELAAAALLALVLAGSAWAAVIAYRDASSQRARETQPQASARNNAPRVQPPPAVPAPPPTQPSVAPQPAQPEPSDTARASEASRDLLEQANRLRAARRWEAAERVYARVAREYAGSDESYVALIASATLRLEHIGRPRDALALYERALALRPAGDLGEQARYGIAEAHRALAQPGAEARALRAFLAAHAHSLRARDARARLLELERAGGF